MFDRLSHELAVGFRPPLAETLGLRFGIGLDPSQLAKPKVNEGAWGLATSPLRHLSEKAELGSDVIRVENADSFFRSSRCSRNTSRPNSRRQSNREVSRSASHYGDKFLSPSERRS